MYQQRLRSVRCATDLCKLLSFWQCLVNLLREVLVRFDDLVVGHGGEVRRWLIRCVGGCTGYTGVARVTEEDAEVETIL